MRICVSGTGSQGKSTFIKDFIKQWPQYTTPKQTYRKFIKKNHSKKTNEKMQWKILNSIVDDIQKYGKEDNVIFDRGPLDNMVYTLWCFSKKTGNITEKFVEKCMPIVKESLKLIDIIFFIPITKVSQVKYDTEIFEEDKALGLTDEDYRSEIDNLFKALKFDWDTNIQSKFFDTENKPAIIEIFGTETERVEMVKLYLDLTGEPIGGENALDTIVTEAEIDKQESLKAQFGISDSQTEAYRKSRGFK